MWAVDTNVLVRFITRDDEAQYTRAAKLLHGTEAVHVPDTVIQECLWVLQSSTYGYARQEIAEALRGICGLPCIELRAPDTVVRLLDLFEAGLLDASDACHLAMVETTCTELLTFDAAFVKRAKGRSPCKVRQPA